jgi:hypothetical protein
VRQIRKMIGGIAIALAAFMVFLPAASASIPSQEPLQAIFGAGSAGVEPMSDQELSQERGGFGGISFSLTGYGNISTLAGGLPEGVEISSQSADLVSLNVGLATLPNTGGFIQFASIVGNNNVINHTLNLNVYILSGGVADTSGIANGSALGF